MSKVILISLLLMFSGTHALFSQSEPLATLEITFTGLRDTDGVIALGIHKGPAGWHKNPDLMPNWKKDNIQSGSQTVRVENLSYGTYAVTMMDDENGNLEMDRILGIPQEGFGFSQNPKVGMSTPKFDECSFKIDKPLVKITIEVIYMGKEK